MFTDLLFEIKLYLLSIVLLKWISKLPMSLEIHCVRQYLINITGLAGIVNATVYKTEPIFTSRAWQIFLIFNTVNDIYFMSTFDYHWLASNIWKDDCFQNPQLYMYNHYNVSDYIFIYVMIIGMMMQWSLADSKRILSFFFQKDDH